MNETNLFMAPFADAMTKTASNEPDPLINVLVSGDADGIRSIMSPEDTAFWKLSEDTRMKLASGHPFSTRDVNSLSDADVSAMTILGDDVAEKCAAYMNFYADVAANERAGRALARNFFLHEKEAAAEQEKLINKVAEDPKFKRALAKKAARELRRRR
jgi:hypothetical protein